MVREERARRTVRQLQASCSAPPEAFDILECALARGNVSAPPEEYLGRILRFIESGVWLVEHLPDETPAEGRSRNWGRHEARGVQLRKPVSPEQFWARSDEIASNQLDAVFA